jgi:hypothetical protein
MGYEKLVRRVSWSAWWRVVLNQSWRRDGEWVEWNGAWRGGYKYYVHCCPLFSTQQLSLFLYQNCPSTSHVLSLPNPASTPYGSELLAPVSKTHRNHRMSKYRDKRSDAEVACARAGAEGDCKIADEHLMCWSAYKYPTFSYFPESTAPSSPYL